MKEYPMWNKVSFFFILTMALMLFTIGIFTNTKSDIDCEDKETFLESEEEETCAGYA